MPVLCVRLEVSPATTGRLHVGMWWNARRWPQLEVKQYVGADGTKTLVPSVIGQTAEVEARKGRRTTSRGQRLDRETLLAIIREQSELAADAAEAILDWADREPRLEVRYTPTSVRLWSASGRLLAIDRRGHLRVFLQTLSDHGKPWDKERIEQLVQELADIGVQLEQKRIRPKAPLEPLADDTRRQEFLTVMERVLDSLAPFPVARRRTRVCRGAHHRTRGRLVREPLRPKLQPVLEFVKNRERVVPHRLIGAFYRVEGLPRSTDSTLDLVRTLDDVHQPADAVAQSLAAELRICALGGHRQGSGELHSYLKRKVIAGVVVVPHSNDAVAGKAA